MSRIWLSLLAGVGIVLLSNGCRQHRTGSATRAVAGETTSSSPLQSVTAHQGFILQSERFDDFGRIPDRYCGIGDDVSPPLSWRGAPEGTACYALIMDDPDAPGGTFTHWLIFNIPGSSSGLIEDVPKLERQESDTSIRQLRNDFGKVGYNGPMPPPGRVHTYVFRLYALSRPVEVPGGASRKQLEDAMRAACIARSELHGTFGR